MNAAVDARRFERRRTFRPAPERPRIASAEPVSIPRPLRERASAGSYEITQPVLFKGHTALASCILLLRVVAPTVVAILTLYAIIRIHDLPITREFTSLLALATVLAAALLQQPHKATTQLLAPEFHAVAGLLVRWCAFLGVLLAIGYLTEASASYPRRVIVTWAIVTPFLLVGVTFAIHRLARAVIARPKNARKVVFVGCTEASVALAERLSRHPELCMAVQG
ncbi:MAG TPA: hypothetical protein VIL28_03850, partial [Steroidobacteraceae bacterium]